MQICVKWAAHCPKYRWWFTNPGHWHCDLGLREWCSVHDSPKTAVSWVFVNSVTVIAWGGALESYCKQPGKATLGFVKLFSAPFSYFDTAFKTKTKASKNKQTKNSSSQSSLLSLPISPAMPTGHASSTAQQCLLDVPPAPPSNDWHLGLTNVWTQLRAKHMSWHLSHYVESGFWVHWLWTVLFATTFSYKS